MKKEGKLRFIDVEKRPDLQFKEPGRKSVVLNSRG